MKKLKGVVKSGKLGINVCIKNLLSILSNKKFIGLHIIIEKKGDFLYILTFFERRVDRDLIRCYDNHILKKGRKNMIATHMKCGKKILCWILAAILVLAAVIPLSTLKASAASGITVVKKYLPDNDPAGRSEVGEFLINGEPAFCLQHKKRSPSSGAVSDSTSPYNNPKVLKALYYGWGGPGQWSGFNGKESGIVLTSLLLDTYYSNGNHSGATSNGVSFNAFKAFVESQPTPPGQTVGFSKTTLNSKWNVKEKKQITEDVTITGDSGDSLTFTVPSGATLVTKEGNKKTGSVTLNAGTTFHFEAPSTVTGNWSSGNVGVGWKYQALIITFPREDGHSTQDVGQLQKFRDPEIKTSLSVKWIDFGSVELKKINEKSEFIDGAKFVLKSFDAATGYDGDGIEYTIKSGKLLIDPVPVGTYTLTEVESPDHHAGTVPSFQVVVNKDQTTEQIVVNRLKPTGDIVINKLDQDTGAGIEGVEFVVYAADDIYDTVSFKKLYDKGDKIKTGQTDATGKCTITGLPMGKMYVQEVKEADGYVPNDKKYSFEFRQQDYTTKVYTHEETIENVQTKTTISKVDATTGAELPGATLQVIDPKDDSVVEEWVSTDTPHVIKGLTYGKEYILKETIGPRTHEVASEIKFKVGADEKVEMKDEPIKIKGQIDKRQTKFGDSSYFDYTIDYRSRSNTWADEFNMIDTIDCAVAGYANVAAIKTPVSFEDYDGKMNIWYKTNKTPSDYKEDAAKYNACATNPENPWNKDKARLTDYSGWKIWKADVSTLESQTLKVSDLKLSDGEYITGIAFEHGRVEKGFTTRTSNWDRSDLKSTDDTIARISTKHSEKFDLSDANGPTKANKKFHYEPAVFYMHVVNEDAAKNLKEFWNSASINIYRNLDQHPDLEDHDNDKVVQKYPIGTIEITDKDKLFGNTVKTGDTMRIFLPLTIALLVISGTAAAMAGRKRKMEK